MADMIIFFGPAGSGKSVQGQILAAHRGWRWLSSGQLLRDTHDTELLGQMQTGKLVSFERVNQIIEQALSRASSLGVVLDGFPRSLEQAKWLVENQQQHKKSIDLVIVLDVPKAELSKRLKLRGRADDASQIIDERLKVYNHETQPILDYFLEHDIRTVHIDGTGTIQQVHNRIIKELQTCPIV
jgi:adenylate kinase